MAEIKKVEVASMADLTKTRDWYSWINLMPPPPNDFHVIGDVLVPNPGVKVMLTQREKSLGDSRTLQMDLFLVQQPGYWVQVVTWAEAKYDRVLKSKSYEKVQIFSDGKIIAEIPVEVIR